MLKIQGCICWLPHFYETDNTIAVDGYAVYPDFVKLITSSTNFEDLAGYAVYHGFVKLITPPSNSPCV
jgi:hypothetical protein